MPPQCPTRLPRARRKKSTLCALAALLLPPLAAGAEPTPTEQLASLSWLAGAWSGTTEHGRWEACYTSPEGGEIFSANKELVDGKVVTYELEHFKVIDNAVVLTPYPYGRKSTAVFKLAACDPQARRAVFANPEHDFPREIVYHRVAEDNLVIEVRGEQRGQPRTLRIDLKRTR
jgi:hypothetical protein